MTFFAYLYGELKKILKEKLSMLKINCEGLGKGYIQCTCMKPSNKNRKLGTLDDFEFVVDYASMISLETIF